MKLLKSFLTDEDGLNQRDFMLFIFTTLYGICLGVAFYISLYQPLNQQTIDILDNLQFIVVTIIGAVFSVQVVNTLKQKTPKSIVEEVKEEKVDYTKMI